MKDPISTLSYRAQYARDLDLLDLAAGRNDPEQFPDGPRVKFTGQYLADATSPTGCCADFAYVVDFPVVYETPSDVETVLRVHVPADHEDRAAEYLRDLFIDIGRTQCAFDGFDLSGPLWVDLYRNEILGPTVETVLATLQRALNAAHSYLDPEAMLPAEDDDEEVQP